jgi:hypothetical protein
MAARFTLGRYKPTGQILNILDADLETRNDFVCTECKGRIVCVLDVPVQTRHFRHKNADSTCRPALETLLHKTAKEIICAHKLIHLPARDPFTYSGEPEISFSKYRPDVTLIGTDKKLLVEIVVSNAMSEEKHLDYQQLGADCLVIDLSDYPRVFHVGDLENELIDQTSRKKYYSCLNYFFKPNENYRNKDSDHESDKIAQWILGLAVAGGLGLYVYNKHFKPKKSNKKA